MAFWIFGILSFLVVAATVIWSVWIYPHQKKLKQMISPLKLRTIGIAVAVFLFLLPVCYLWDVWQDEHTYLRPVLLALINTVRVFLMGLDFDFVEKILPKDPLCCKVLLSLYAMGLFVTAPMLTFGNVLAMFKNLSGELRVYTCRKRKLYVMSELNPQSIALAQSIANKSGIPAGEKSLIVFCDVFAQNEEGNYELLLRARELDAICLKKDVSHVKFSTRGKEMEFFLVGENETENITQSIRLTEKYKNASRKTGIYIFSSDPTTDYILDSMDMGDKLLSTEFDSWLEKHAEQILREGRWPEKDCAMFGNFSIHHIDPTEFLVTEVLSRENYGDFRRIQQAANSTGTVSVTILGMGQYGARFLKTAVWFYQRYGIRVECNIFDLEQQGTDLEKRLGQECPELIAGHHTNEDGEALYDLRFFTGVDCFSSDFDNKLLKEDAQRFDNTNLVFVALGDDDRNICAARMVETLFTQKQRKTGRQMPLIYAVVYNDEKAANLNVHNAAPENGGIRFVGARLDQYAYAKLLKQNAREAAALAYHLDWLSKECQLRNAYTIAVNGPADAQRPCYEVFRQNLDRELKGEAPRWNDGDYYQAKDGSVDYEGPVLTEKVRQSVAQYMRGSYFRKSSLSKALHKEAHSRLADPSLECKTGDGPLCACDGCTRKRITEHMRWNAYMRSLGYQNTDGPKSREAKLHPSLRSWHALDCRERYKD